MTSIQGGQKFLSEKSAALIQASHCGRGGLCSHFSHTAHCHTHVRACHVYHNTLRTSRTFDSIGNLCREAFLHLKTPGIHIYDAGYFAKPYNCSVGDVRNGTATVEREKMVLTK